jgi:hypothetical protein
MRKKPSIAETLDWARALVSLNRSCLDGKVVADTLNLLLKPGPTSDRFFVTAEEQLRRRAAHRRELEKAAVGEIGS